MPSRRVLVTTGSRGIGAASGSWFAAGSTVRLASQARARAMGFTAPFDKVKFILSALLLATPTSAAENCEDWCVGEYQSVEAMCGTDVCNGCEGCDTPCERLDVEVTVHCACGFLHDDDLFIEIQPKWSEAESQCTTYLSDSAHVNWNSVFTWTDVPANSEISLVIWEHDTGDATKCHTAGNDWGGVHTVPVRSQFIFSGRDFCDTAPDCGCKGGCIGVGTVAWSMKAVCAGRSLADQAVPDGILGKVCVASDEYEWSPGTWPEDVCATCIMRGGECPVPDPDLDGESRSMRPGILAVIISTFLLEMVSFL